MDYVLYSSDTNKNGGEAIKNEALKALKGEISEVRVVNTKEIELDDIIKKVKLNDRIVFIGDDIDLNIFINVLKKYGIRNKCYLYNKNIESGEDFIKDIETKDKKLISINQYLENIPTVTFNGITKYFLNDVCYGVDGQAFSVIDRKKKSRKKHRSYTTTLAGLVLRGKCKFNAKVVVDKKEYNFKKVLIASTMNGRTFEKLKITPNQDRLSNTVSLIIILGKGRLYNLFMLGRIKRGKHIKSRSCKIIEGSEIDVYFDTPCGIEYDGIAFQKVLHYKIVKGKRR